MLDQPVIVTAPDSLTWAEWNPTAEGEPTQEGLQVCASMVATPTEVDDEQVHHTPVQDIENHPLVLEIPDEELYPGRRFCREPGIFMRKNASDARLVTVRISIEILASAGITTCSRGMLFAVKGGGVCIFLGNSPNCPISRHRTAKVTIESGFCSFMKTVSDRASAVIFGDAHAIHITPELVTAFEKENNKFLVFSLPPQKPKQKATFGGVQPGTTPTADNVPPG